MGVDSLDYGGPFPIPLLGLSRSSASFSTGNYHAGCREKPHQKPGFVEVIDILFRDAVLGNCTPNKVKPLLKDGWIFTKDPLVVYFPI